MARYLFPMLLIAASLLAGSPAGAQFPNIFEQLFNPPRPPSDIPDRPLPPPGTQQQRPQSGLPPGPPPGRIQQRPLPPPPGSASAPTQQPPGVQSPAETQRPGLPPG